MCVPAHDYHDRFRRRVSSPALQRKAWVEEPASVDSTRLVVGAAPSRTISGRCREMGAATRRGCFAGFSALCGASRSRGPRILSRWRAWRGSCRRGGTQPGHLRITQREGKKQGGGAGFLDRLLGAGVVEQGQPDLEPLKVRTEGE